MVTNDHQYRCKIKSWKSAKERDQKLLDFITIDILKLEQQHNSSEDIINLSMNPIINTSFNRHLMSWDIIHHRLLHPSESVMKTICCHQTLYGLPKVLLRKYAKDHEQYYTQQKE